LRNVRGVLFADYVRMIRRHKAVDWQPHLRPEDVRWLAGRIEADDWYPMESFERIGNAILREVAGGDLGAVRAWGRRSVDRLRAVTPSLVAAGDPVDTLMRFRVLRSTYFDFEALEVPVLYEGHAEVIVHYHMGPTAEEAASHHALGFFERLLEVAGAEGLRAELEERCWAGDPRTVLSLGWSALDG
jgi:hypothetical protein